MTAAKAFIGVDGVSIANGLSANSELEAAHTLALIRQSAQIYLLCDSTKLEQDRYLHFAPLSAIGVLVTDDKADKALLTMYQEAGVRVIV